MGTVVGVHGIEMGRRDLAALATRQEDDAGNR